MQIVIYGAGNIGREALADIGRENVLCFVDQEKSGELDGCPIYKLKDIPIADEDEVLFLITPRRYRREIADTLLQAGYHRFVLYTHVRGGGTARPLDADEWGEIYNQRILDQVVSDVHKQRRSSWSKEMLRLTRPGERVLEIGCGSGATTLQLAAENRICTAIDYSKESICLVRRAANVLSLSVETRLTDARQELPFADDAFDVVFQAGLLEHFERAERVRLLRLWQRVGRTMVSLIPNANSIAYHAGKFLQEQAGDWEYGMELPQATMKDEFIEAGYQQIREYTIGLKDAFSFLPEQHYLRIALERWFTDHPEPDYGQGYLLCTIGEK